MDLRFKGKVVIVTGGGAGIGEAAAKMFAEEGAKVVIADIDVENARRVMNEVRAKGGICDFVEVNVAKENDVEMMVNTVMEKYRKIDVLVNNAGIYRKGDVLSLTEDTLDQIIAVNIKGVIFCTKHVAKQMVKQGEGVIVNIASEAGIVGIKNQVAYNLSKAAVISITKSCAVDLAPYGIRVNCVCPGTTFTPLVKKALEKEKDPESAKKVLESSRPLNRLGKPEEIASTILFLASDVPGYATGAVLSIDGGYTAW